MMGDAMLACLLGEVYTDVEKTMIELQRDEVVRQTRSTFQQAIQRRFIAIVEQHSGRRVAEFFSAHHVGPDLELELFMLEHRVARRRSATDRMRGTFWGTGGQQTGFPAVRESSVN